MLNVASLTINWFEAFSTEEEKAVLKVHPRASHEDVVGKKKVIANRLEELCKARLKDFFLSTTGEIPQKFKPSSKAIFLVNTLATDLLALEKANEKLPVEGGGGTGGGSVGAPTRYRVDMNVGHFKRWREVHEKEQLERKQKRQRSG